MKDIVQTLSLLYELSLNSMTSFDPSENCRNFLRRVVERTLFISAFVFVREENGLRLLCSFPSKEEPPKLGSLPSKDFALLDKRTVVFSLGDTGVLVARAAEEIPPEYPVKFLKVFKEFGYGTKGLLAIKNLSKAAYKDPLTDLPNRRFFNEKMERLIKDEIPFSLYLLDLDNFKHINDIFGHSVGDQVIKGFARWLRSLDDSWDIARIGGDEFGLIVVDQNIDEVMRKLFGNPCVKLTAGSYDFDIRFSVGFSSFPAEGLSSRDLLVLADIRLYVAKDRLKSKLEVYPEEVVKTLTLSTEAINIVFHDNVQIFPVYQPIFDVEKNDVVGLEALLRFGDIDVPVESIIQIAEKFGKIFSIERRLFPYFVEHGRKLPKSIRLHINISPVDIYKREFWETLKRSTREGLNPESVVIELTEREIYEDIVSAKLALFKLKSLGFHIAMDDIGKGYSSLQHLKDLPIDIAKVDKDFVLDVPESKKNTSIVKALKSMCDEIGLMCIAEGVERKKTFNYLRDLNFRYMQGFWFSEPLKFEELIERGII